MLVRGMKAVASLGVSSDVLVGEDGGSNGESLMWPRLGLVIRLFRPRRLRQLRALRDGTLGPPLLRDSFLEWCW